MQDHLDLYAISECTGDHTYDRVARPHRTVWAGIQYLLFKTGPVTSTLFETGGFWYADKDARSPDIQFHLGLGSGNRGGRRSDEEPRRHAQFRVPPPPLARHGATRERGSESRAADRPQLLGRPLRSRLCALRGLRLAREILRQPALKPFVLAERLPGDNLNTDEELAEYAYRSCKTDHHPAGTCAMGSGPEAVVTPDLKLRGIDGLRVVDASVMPFVPSCNTNAPTIMVAEKASDIILGNEPLARRCLIAAAHGPSGLAKLQPGTAGSRGPAPRRNQRGARRALVCEPPGPRRDLEDDAAGVKRWQCV